jgi:uncharacterized membrane protein
MNWFLLLKTLHVMSAIVAVGANVTYGVWSSRGERDPDHLGFALRGVIFLDQRIANPAYGVLLVTGVVMAVTQYTISMTWILTGLAIYIVVALLAVVVLSPAMKRQVTALETEGQASAAYRSARSTVAGVGMFIAVLLVLVIADMVVKPQL